MGMGEGALFSSNRESNTDLRWGDSEQEGKTSFLSHSKNITLKRKARRARYRTVGMTQQAMEWQPVWAARCSGRQKHSHCPFWQPSAPTAVGKMGKSKLPAYMRVWSEVSNEGKCIPKRLSHSFVPMWAVQLAV